MVYVKQTFCQKRPCAASLPPEPAVLRFGMDMGIDPPVARLARRWGRLCEDPNLAHISLATAKSRSGGRSPDRATVGSRGRPARERSAGDDGQVSERWPVSRPRHGGEQRPARTGALRR
jgi:hypothetical protein